MKLFQHRTKQLLTFLISLIFIISCDNFEFSPNQTHDYGTPKALNEQNLARLRQNTANDTVTIVFTGDSQRWYQEADKFVDKVNSLPNADLVLLAGDISDFGLLQEFKWVNERLSKLNIPYFGVIGNHDVVANGAEVFRQMFGPLNYSFVYGDIKFIAHNTNGLEYPNEKVPDLDWLSRELANTEKAKHIVTISHVPPFNPQEFNEKLVEPYKELLKNTPSLLVSLHGHVHKHLDFYPFEDGVHYMTSFSFEQRAFLLLKIADGKVFKTIIDY